MGKPGLASNIPAPHTRSPPRPEKVARVRANSASMPSPQATRKRTSSGLIQVDDAEPPPKKAEHTRTLSDGALKKSKVVSNGRRKLVVTSKDVEVKEQKKIIDRFDSKVKTACVTAFKESDSWD